MSNRSNSVSADCDVTRQHVPKCKKIDITKTVQTTPPPPQSNIKRVGPRLRPEFSLIPLIPKPRSHLLPGSPGGPPVPLHLSEAAVAPQRSPPAAR